MNTTQLIHSLKDALASSFLLPSLSVSGSNPFAMQANNGLHFSKAVAGACGDKVSLAACGDKASFGACGDKSSVAACGDKVSFAACGDK